MLLRSDEKLWVKICNFYMNISKGVASRAFMLMRKNECGTENGADSAVNTVC